MIETFPYGRGTMSHLLHPEGRVRNFLYDEANRLVRESTATSSGDALVQKYTLDDDGKPTAVTDELNTTETIAYDAFEGPALGTVLF